MLEEFTMLFMVLSPVEMDNRWQIHSEICL
jgi:hypothetical protein